MENHQAFETSLTYIKTVSLAGYRMYSLGDYPYAICTGDQRDNMVVDLFRVLSEETEEMIYEMERDAGYVRSIIMIDGIKFGIYLFETMTIGDEYLPGGDWVSYTKSQLF